MKKNKAMRLGSAVLVLALLTSCAICSTFAKYTTTAGGTDSARVAYWGFDTDSTTTFSLFSNTYDSGAVKASGKTGTATTADKVVAPGTSQDTSISFQYKSLASPSITAPEVAYTLVADVKTTGIDGTGTADVDALDANPNFVWKLTVPGGSEKTFQTLNGREADAEKGLAADDGLIPTLKNALAGSSSGSYNAGTLPDGLNSSSVYKIGWSWEYDTTNDDEQDVTDTAMGNATDLDDLAITIKITATQKDS